MHSHIPLRSRPIPALLLSLLISACGGSGTPTGSGAEAGRTTARQTVVLPTAAVSAHQLCCGEREFRSHVQWGVPDAHTPIPQCTLRFTVSSFLAFATKHSCPTTQDTRGFIVHFGADEETGGLSFAYGFTCMPLDAQGHGPLRLDSALLVVGPGEHLVPSPAGLRAWRAGPGRVFQDHVLVDTKDDGTFRALYADRPGHVVYKLDEVLALIVDNDLAPTDLVEVVPIAEPERWGPDGKGSGFHLTTTLVALRNKARVISDVPPAPGAPMFKDRGADLGVACPPICDEVRFRSTGTPVRSTCKCPS